jgi:hypothetical protein
MPSKAECQPSAEGKEPLSPRLRPLLTLFITSYEHSQGNSELQRTIFHYLHQSLPDLTLTKKDCDQLMAHAIPIIERLLGLPTQVQAAFPHTQVDDISIVRSVGTEIEHLYSIFTRSTTLEAEVVELFAKKLVEREYDILIKDGGRKQRRIDKEKTRYQSRYDPHFSYVAYFALMGHKTGMQPLDHLYQASGVFYHHWLEVARNDLIPEWRAILLKHVLKAYNHSHPTTPVTFDVEPVYDETD